jgi:predicted regulator of Ras-like GTPase activity (Roadblock/LC7/MglB family)
MDELVDTGRSFTSCVVTNERGLVVAERSVDGLSSQTLAAMVSLMSDTAIRVSENLGCGHPRSSSIRALGVSVSVQKFMVGDRPFWIGAVLSGESQSSRGLIRRRLGRGRMEAKLLDASRKLQSILEE